MIITSPSLLVESCKDIPFLFNFFYKTNCDGALSNVDQTLRHVPPGGNCVLHGCPSPAESPR